MYIDECDLVRSEVKTAIQKTLEKGFFRDTLSVDEVHALVFDYLEIPVEEKMSHHAIMTVIKEEIFSQFNRKLGASRKKGKYVRLYRGLKKKEAN